MNTAKATDAIMDPSDDLIHRSELIHHSELIYRLVELCGFHFIHLTTASGNTIDGEPPSLKIPTHFYITISK